MKRVSLILIYLIIISSACNQKENSVEETQLNSLIEIDTIIQEKEEIKDKYANLEVISVFPQKSYEQNIFPAEILMKGDFHGNEVSQDVETKVWYGLFLSKNDECKLQKTEIVLEKILDPILDEKNDEPSGIRINVNKDDSLLILLSKIELQENLSIQRVKNHPIQIIPDEDYKFNFSGIKYKLKAKGIKECIEESNQCFVVRNYELYLEREIGDKTIESLISSFPYFDDSMIEVLFIGDIDSDGKIDLIIDNSPKYNSFIPTVYLSSLAEDGELLKVVAMGIFLGC